MANRSKPMIRAFAFMFSALSISAVIAGPFPKDVEAFENSFRQCSSSRSIISPGPMGLSITHRVLGRTPGGCQVEIQLSHPAAPGEDTTVRCNMDPGAPYTHQVSDLFNNDFSGCTQQ